VEIVWLGHSCFRLKSREAVVITDPFGTGEPGENGEPGSEARLSLGKTVADIVTVSHHHPDHDNAAAVGGSPHVIDGPGEYEVKGVVVTGVPTFHDAEHGKARGKNTSYLIEMDDVVVCHLGDLGHVLNAAQVEAMSRVDVLIVPVGGGATINAAQAAEVISLVEPKIVIPTHYRLPGTTSEQEPVDRFLRDMGVSNAEPQPKLSVSASNLPESLQVVLLEPRG
jgi:L-ascorbate metabolism protein UlaG (beta-lactamase superfamily)